MSRLRIDAESQSRLQSSRIARFVGEHRQSLAELISFTRKTRTAVAVVVVAIESGDAVLDRVWELVSSDEQREACACRVVS